MFRCRESEKSAAPGLNVALPHAETTHVGDMYALRNDDVPIKAYLFAIRVVFLKKIHTHSPSSMRVIPFQLTSISRETQEKRITSNGSGYSFFPLV